MRVKYEHVLAFAVIDRELSVERQELISTIRRVISGHRAEILEAWREHCGQ